MGNVWLVVEVVREKLELKVRVFGGLNRLCPADCILASNRGSYKPGELGERVTEQDYRIT